MNSWTNEKSLPMQWCMCTGGVPHRAENPRKPNTPIPSSSRIFNQCTQNRSTGVPWPCPALHSSWHVCVLEDFLLGRNGFEFHVWSWFIDFFFSGTTLVISTTDQGAIEDKIGEIAEKERRKGKSWKKERKQCNDGVFFRRKQEKERKDPIRTNKIF